MAALVEYRKEIRRWKKEHGADTTKPRIPDFIGKCIYLICTKLGTRGNFSGYSYIEDMKGDAILNCTSAVHNFDPKKSSNPYGYFGRVAWQAFVRYIEKEADQTYVKIKNFEYLHTLDDRGEIKSNDGDSKAEPTTVRNIFTDEFIRNFEAKRERKKERQKAKLKKPLAKRKKRKKKTIDYDASLQKFFN